MRHRRALLKLLPPKPKPVQQPVHKQSQNEQQGVLKRTNPWGMTEQYQPASDLNRGSITNTTLGILRGHK